jgi:hypothetical protein
MKENLGDGPALTLGDQGQDHVSAVAIAEPLAGPEFGRVPAEHGQVRPGAGELVRRHREHVAGDLVPVLLIEVAAEPERCAGRCLPIGLGISS